MIQSPRDEGFKSSLHSLHTGNQALKKCEGLQNYLAGSRDGDDLIPGQNMFPCAHASIALDCWCKAFVLI
ncbi:unnamed protein product [Lathyrus oleraceus]